MSELRNRPGEVLDRVAEGGEAFIIERSGQRRACLVPLSVFLPDIAPQRIADELRRLEEEGAEPRTTITPDRELAFRFREPATQGLVEVTIVLPHGYPHACPRVYAAPLPTNAPHRWSDGSLCVFGLVTVWNPGSHTVASTLSLARQWLTHCDAWQKTGQWPKG